MYIKLFSHDIEKASIAMASASGNRDIYLAFLAFSLEAKRSISNFPKADSKRSKIVLSKDHSVSAL